MNRTLFFSGILLICACAQERESSDTLFTLMPYDQTGIDFRNNLVEDIYSINNVLSFEYFYNGGGVAIGDINNDGLQDLFFTGNTTENKLYLNQGKFKFKDITKDAGIPNTNKNFSTGVCMADVNQDGLLDIYVCQGGPSPDPAQRQNLLYINQGDLTFKESAAELGLNDSNRSTQAAFFDYDHDGDVDCFIMNYSKYAREDIGLVLLDLKNKDRLIEACSRLMRNDDGHFTDVTEEAGMLQYGYGLGLMVSDLNEDGWLDVYQANDYSVPDFMYINNGDGTFTDDIKNRTEHVSWFAMGVDVADINNDGLCDIGVVDMAATDHVRDKTLMAPMDPNLFWYSVNDLSYQYQYMFNSLQLNLGKGNYSNIANLAGMARTEWSWAALFADFDNDGYKDYFVSNGNRRYYRDNDFRNNLVKAKEENGGSVPAELRKELFDQIPQIKLANMMAQNDGHLHFTDMAATWGLGQPCYSNGAAYGDLDNDGDLDLVISNIDDIAYVYRNNATELNNNHSLRVVLESPHSVIGTRVRATEGDQIYLVEYSPVRGFQSSVDPVLHLGLGALTTVDLDVTWPDGTKQTLDHVALGSGKTLTLRYEDGTHANTTVAGPDAMFSRQDIAALGLDFVHAENVYNDFATEVLLPYKQSTLGPLMSKGDVNADGLEDFFVGGASGQSGTLYLQRPDGRFSAATTHPWAEHKSSEDCGSLFFDADGDGDQDLYIVSGGNEFEPGSSQLQDRLYLNNGSGIFSYARGALPVMKSSGFRIAAADFDGDGDLDLFVGGRHIPGHYPDCDKSYLLKNTNGRFEDVTDALAPSLRRPGMINDVHWTDLNNDGRLDLLLAVEWGPVMYYLNSESGFENNTVAAGLDAYHGWWMRLLPADVDGDGDLDLIAGNLGLNSKFYASAEKPFRVFAADFDGTGSWDLVLSKEYHDHLVPMRGRQCSSEQMPFIKEKFPTYSAFANASLEDIYGKDKLDGALQLETTELHSVVFMNDAGIFSPQPLPIEAQFSPLYGIAVQDVNADGNPDIVACGNLFQTEIETPRLDAGYGVVLIGDGSGGFRSVNPQASGFHARGDVKDMIVIRSSGAYYFIVSQNNGPLQAFRIVADSKDM